MISFWAEIESLTTILRHNPQKDWELPSGHKRPQPPQKASRVQRPKSNKFISFQLPRIPVESTNRCNEANGKSTRLKSFTLESHHKQLMLMGGEERKNNEEHNKWNFKIKIY